MLFEEMYFGIQFDLFFFGEAIPPGLELIGVLDLPRHPTNITYMEYNFDGILTKLMLSRLLWVFHVICKYLLSQLSYGHAYFIIACKFFTVTAGHVPNLSC